ncbi:alkaline shock response membrane anchor protein AmaP [Priestia megaterium]|uniref:alkaline shock response membrane anchor protein AmaP n=1 Tax=Priestia megaterium TaxID=1404 RepID=UPI00209D23FB|nr:alkaline shock response membrane anchor protein AmaP [Priestia megaterium]MCP1452005.1 putative alkaline shock family protein YloU [Priestia megaterium]
MNNFNRFLIAIIGIAGLICSGMLALMVYKVPHLSNWVEKWQHQEWFYYTILSISAFLAVIFIIFLLTGIFSRPPKKNLAIVTGEGKITISKTTIESTALRAIRSFQGIRSPEVQASIHSRKERVSLYINCSLFGRDGLPTLGKEMQLETKRAVEALLELPVHSVRIDLTDTQTRKKERVV